MKYFYITLLSLILCITTRATTLSALFPLYKPSSVLVSCNKVIDSFNSSNSKHINLAGYYYLKAMAEKKLQHYEESVKDFDAAIEVFNMAQSVHPYQFQFTIKIDNDSTYFYMFFVSPWSAKIEKASTLMYLPKKAEGLSLLDEVISGESNREEKILALTIKSKFEIELNNFDEAIKLCDLALTMDSMANQGNIQNFNTLNIRGYANLKLSNYKAAIRDFDMSVMYASINENPYFAEYDYRDEAHKKYINSEKKYAAGNVSNFKDKKITLDSLKLNITHMFKFVEGGIFEKHELIKNSDQISKVNVSGFYISKYEVTQGLWEIVMNINPSFHNNCSKCPVENVNWYDINDFIIELNKITGKKFRLPTENEWEYAASAGDYNRKYVFSGSDTLDKVGWYWNNANNSSHKVGQKLGNEQGLYDLSGNVMEWCDDTYNSDPDQKMIHGGSYFYPPNSSTIFKRDGFNKKFRSISLGFRLVMDK